jgi:hypothetical protein
MSAPARLQQPDRNAYFGDLKHVHTYLSNDAYIFNVRRSPDDAYRFAKGEAIGHASGFDDPPGRRAPGLRRGHRPRRVHGAVREAGETRQSAAKLPFSRTCSARMPAAINAAFTAFVEGSRSGRFRRNTTTRPDRRSRLGRDPGGCRAHNQPGRFTTLIGYEFTSAPDGRNLHRNVIFRGSKVPGAPFAPHLRRSGRPVADDGRLAVQGHRGPGHPAQFQRQRRPDVRQRPAQRPAHRPGLC